MTNENQQQILNILIKENELRSSQIHERILESGKEVSLVTVKRELSSLKNDSFITQLGTARNIRYKISVKGRAYFRVDHKAYSEIEPDKRYGNKTFNFQLIQEFPDKIFSTDDISELDELTEKFHRKSQKLSPLLVKKELERLVIELSWKSSKIEGNTYTLLDTERLIRENKEAIGHTKEESQMILNHKNAFESIYQNRRIYTKVSKVNIQEIHKILVQDLEIQNKFRSGSVGITGSIYRPLDNSFQITDAVEDLCKLINEVKNPYDKSLLALAFISYIQPFEDGNKRTSRLLTNAILMAHDLAPLSYRGVDEEDYRAAILAFYELNTIIPIKEIFFEQYKSAAESYSIQLI